MADVRASRVNYFRKLRAGVHTSGVRWLDEGCLKWLYCTRSVSDLRALWYATTSMRLFVCLPEPLLPLPPLTRLEPLDESPRDVYTQASKPVEDSTSVVATSHHQGVLGVAPSTANSMLANPSLTTLPPPQPSASEPPVLSAGDTPMREGMLSVVNSLAPTPELSISDDYDDDFDTELPASAAPAPATTASTTTKPAVTAANDSALTATVSISPRLRNTSNSRLFSNEPASSLTPQPVAHSISQPSSVSASGNPSAVASSKDPKASAEVADEFEIEIEDTDEAAKKPESTNPQSAVGESSASRAVTVDPQTLPQPEAPSKSLQSTFPHNVPFSTQEPSVMPQTTAASTSPGALSSPVQVAQQKGVVTPQMHREDTESRISSSTSVPVAISQPIGIEPTPASSSLPLSPGRAAQSPSPSPNQATMTGTTAPAHTNPPSLQNQLGHAQASDRLRPTSLQDLPPPQNPTPSTLPPLMPATAPGVLPSELSSITPSLPQLTSATTSPLVPSTSGITSHPVSQIHPQGLLQPQPLQPQPLSQTLTAQAQFPQSGQPVSALTQPPLPTASSTLPQTSMHSHPPNALMQPQPLTALAPAQPLPQPQATMSNGMSPKGTASQQGVPLGAPMPAVVAPAQPPALAKLSPEGKELLELLSKRPAVKPGATRVKHKDGFGSRVFRFHHSAVEAQEKKTKAIQKVQRRTDIKLESKHDKQEVVKAIKKEWNSVYTTPARRKELEQRINEFLLSEGVDLAALEQDQPQYTYVDDPYRYARREQPPSNAFERVLTGSELNLVLQQSFTPTRAAPTPQDASALSQFPSKGSLVTPVVSQEPSVDAQVKPQAQSPLVVEAGLEAAKELPAEAGLKHKEMQRSIAPYPSEAEPLEDSLRRVELQVFQVLSGLAKLDRTTLRKLFEGLGESRPGAPDRPVSAAKPCSAVPNQSRGPADATAVPVRPTTAPQDRLSHVRVTTNKSPSQTSSARMAVSSPSRMSQPVATESTASTEVPEILCQVCSTEPAVYVCGVLHGPLRYAPSCGGVAMCKRDWAEVHAPAYMASHNPQPVTLEYWQATVENSAEGSARPLTGRNRVQPRLRNAQGDASGTGMTSYHSTCTPQTMSSPSRASTTLSSGGRGPTTTAQVGALRETILKEERLMTAVHRRPSAQSQGPPVRNRESVATGGALGVQVGNRLYV